MPVWLTKALFADKALEGALYVEDWFVIGIIALVHDVLNPLLLLSLIPLTSEIFSLELSLLCR